MLTEELDALNYGKQKDIREIFSVDRELKFTAVYQEYESAHPYEREIACLRTQVQETLQPFQLGDWFAGRIDRALVGIDPERGDLVEAAYFCRFGTLEEWLEKPETPEKLKESIHYLIRFWRSRVTHRFCREAFPEEVREGLPKDDYYNNTEISYPMFGLGGPCLDFGKLVRLGIPGFRVEVKKYGEAARETPETDLKFYQLLDEALDLLAETALNYARQAEELAQNTTGEDEKERARLVAASLQNIAASPPRSYHEAIQLVWLYTLVALPRNYGRADVYLGDLLALDLDSGALTHEMAREMTIGWWRMILARGDNFNNRILIGGKGRPNEKEADLFALLALEVQGLLNETIPQLSLRWYEGMDPKIWEKAVEVIGGGSTFPILYNDDVNVPALAKAFGVSEDEAEQYMMYGCGEILLNHRSVGSPDAAMNVLKTLDVTLHNGIETITGEKKGLALGGLYDFTDFRGLQEAFARQIDYQVELLVKAQATIYRVTGERAAFPFLSLLYDDCIARGKPLLSGGVRHLGGTLESFGNNSAADSLLAIKKAVYEDKLISPMELLECLKRNFEGYESLRARLLALPKYGNDDPEADAMSLWVNQTVCEAAKRWGERVGLDSFLVVLINNGDSVLFGKTTAASADGRKAGEPLSNGNQPSAGMDQCGVTALLNSMAKLDPSLHAGTTQNIKVSREMFQSRRREMSALLEGYFANGGTQIMITVTDRGELERAFAEPERYGNLVVRVGGYSERFVNLPREIQQEVIRRTVY